MSDQVQELLKRVYEEGVAKAKAEASGIVDAAKSEAEQILSDAKKQASVQIAEASKKAEELSRNTHSDLKNAAQQTLSVVRQKLSEMLMQASFGDSSKAAFADADFVKKLIVEALQAWKASMDNGVLTISEGLKADIDQCFVDSLSQILKGQLRIEFQPQMKDGFTIAPQDGTYKLSFTDEDFANLFKSFLRPRTNQILFKD